MTRTLGADLVEALELGPGGFQLYATGDHATIDLAGGFDALGRPMTTRTRCNLFCLTKPVWAAFCLWVAERKGIGVHERLPIEVAGDGQVETSLGGLLAHRCGLAHPTAAEWRMTPAAMRPGVRSQVQVTPSNAYSEIVGGLLLEEWCAAVLEPQDLRQELARWMVDLGLDDGLAFHPPPAAGGGAPLAAHVFIDDDHGAVPLLSELCPEHLAEIRPAFGALGAARGVGRFLALVGVLLRGAPTAAAPFLPSPSVLRSALQATRTPPLHDAVLGYPAQFSAGFQHARPALPGLEGLDASCIGHTAGMSVAFGFVHPGTGHTCTLITNRIVTDRRVMAQRRRAAVQVLQEHAVAGSLWHS